MFRFSIRFFRLLRFSRLFRPLMKFKMEVGLFKVWKCELDIIWDCGTKAEQESELNGPRLCPTSHARKRKVQILFWEDLGNNAINSSLQNASIQEHPKRYMEKPQLTFHRRSFLPHNVESSLPEPWWTTATNETVNATGLRQMTAFLHVQWTRPSTFHWKYLSFFICPFHVFFHFSHISHRFHLQLDCRSQMLLAQSEETYDHHCEEILQFLDTYVVKIPLHHQKMYPLQHWKLLE